MSVARPARCLLSMAPCTSRPTTACTAAASLRRSFHASPAHSKRRRPHYPNIKASDMQQLRDFAGTRLPTYSAEDKALLAAKYTPAQIAALEAGESAVDPVDMLLQNKSRAGDQMAIHYEEDFAGLNYFGDRPVRKELDNKIDYSYRAKTDDELTAEIADFWIEEGERLQALNLADNDPRLEEEEDKAQVRYMKFLNNPRTFMHAESEEAYDALLDPGYNVTAPEVPKVDEAVELIKRSKVDPVQKRLLLETGLTPKEVSTIRVRILDTRMVVNQTRLGKVRSYYFIAAAGNGNGLLGVGEGKSTEPAEASKASTTKAIKNMRPIPRYENRTIYGEMKGKVGAVELTVSARPPGFGLRVQFLIYEMARMAGIRDLAARVDRSRNKMNVVKATWQALLGQKVPEDVARARGIKLVDARKVYYGGRVL